MMAAVAVMGARGGMLIQKGTTGHVDSRRAAIDTAIGAIPSGGTARLGRASARSRCAFFRPPPELFYRDSM